jgi:thymidylate synthase
MSNSETQYLNLLSHVMGNGNDRSDRTGTGTRSVFGAQMRFDLSEGFPLLTTKRVHFKSVIVELLWFLRGDTNVGYLREHGVTIWDEWRRRYTLDRPTVLVEPRKPAPGAEYDGDFSVAGHGFVDIDRKLGDAWVRMMRRCYDPSHHRYGGYGALGVTVAPEWHDPSVFVRDVKTLPHWDYKAAEWSGFELDKDYYGASQYGPETSVWLSTEENNMYTSSAKPIEVVEADGTGHGPFVTQADAARAVGIPTSTLSRFLTGPPKVLKGANKRFLGWEFKEYVSDRLLRLELIAHGDMGRIYGAQWRDFGGVDQIANVIEQIKTNPDSRRLIVSAWNPAEVDYMALPPCHTMFQFYVHDGRLSCHLYQRSGDLFLGVPFNIASYALLTHIVARLTGLGVGEFVHSLGDAHIYHNHFDQVRTQLGRRPRDLPTIRITDRGQTAPEDFEFLDLGLANYDPAPSIPAPVAV